MNRSGDWWEQAVANLTHARNSVRMEDYAWACFAAHQAAEAAVKALHMKAGQIAWGHSITELLMRVPAAFAPTERLVECGKSLDRHYIPTRYPDAYPAGPAH